MGPLIENANEVFTRWRAEDEALGTQVDTIRQWMRELDQIGKQHFGETATRLCVLRSFLLEHFEHEAQMVVGLRQVYGAESPEVAELERQSNCDHDRLLGRVDRLIERLNQLEPPFETWQQAMDEIESLVSLLERHEANEWDNLESLLPG